MLQASWQQSCENMPWQMIKPRSFSSTIAVELILHYSHSSMGSRGAVKLLVGHFHQRAHAHKHSWKLLYCIAPQGLHTVSAFQSTSSLASMHACEALEHTSSQSEGQTEFDMPSSCVIQ